MDDWIGKVCICNVPGGGRKEWTVAEKLTFIDDEVTITVLPGAITDGASIPRFFWRFIGGPFSGLYIAAALIHDQLYKVQGAGLFTRKEVDMMFKRAMLSLGVSSAKAEMMYRAVRMGGGWVDKATLSEIAHQMKFIEIATNEI